MERNKIYEQKVKVWVNYFKNTTLFALAANVGPMMQKMCRVDLMTNQNALYDLSYNEISDL